MRRGRSGRIRREPAPPDLRDREPWASYSELAATSTACRMPSLSLKETRQHRESKSEGRFLREQRFGYYPTRSTELTQLPPFYVGLFL